jgi:hypothetical protein
MECYKMSCYLQLYILFQRSFFNLSRSILYVELVCYEKGFDSDRRAFMSVSNKR